MFSSAITITLSPEIDLGPVSVPWHGLMTAVGVVVALVVAALILREWRLSIDPLLQIAPWVLLGSFVGARFFFLAQTDASALLRPTDWPKSTGYALYGALISGLAIAWALLRRSSDRWRYLDALAVAFPIAMAVGRVGDLILGEHFGPPTNAPWGFAYTNPDSVAPQLGVAYQSGAFYEMVGSLLIFAAAWPMRNRFRRPGSMLWSVLIAYAALRFVVFFAIRDTDVIALGLRQAQWTSLVLIAVGAVGLVMTRRRSSGASHLREPDATAATRPLRAAD